MSLDLCVIVAILPLALSVVPQSARFHCNYVRSIPRIVRLEDEGCGEFVHPTEARPP